jgi:hypothetical protein
MSFERAPDCVRIEALLQADPSIKILSVSLHPAPVAGENGEMKQLGTLRKFFPTRYEHCETNFREERGLKTLSARILTEGKPAVGYLDYAWLQVRARSPFAQFQRGNCSLGADELLQRTTPRVWNELASDENRGEKCLGSRENPNSF